MSTAIILYAKAADAEGARARLADTTIATELADVSASLVRKPNFLAELYGFDPTVKLYFALNKTMLPEARAAIADVVRSFLESSDDDMVAVYVDFPIVKRVGELRLCNERFREFVPPDQPWTFVAEIPFADD